jgi:drug/metabolite transporter (DMT)-like permease
MNRTMKDTYTGSLLMAATAFLWSIAGLFIKIIDWNPFYIALFRSLIASLLIIVVIRRFKFVFSFPLIAAGMANALTMILFVFATKTTLAANAIILQYTAPIITSFLCFYMLKEKLERENIISVIAITAGMIIMFFDKVSYGSWIGNLAGLLSAFTFSFYFIFMRMQKNGATIEPVLLSHIFTVIFCSVIVFFVPAPKLSTPSILSVMVLGIFQIGITSIFFAMAIRKISALSAVLIAVIEPVFNPIWVFLVLGERPGINGLLIVVTATVASLISARRKNLAVATGIAADGVSP